jgi:hypothetical protein
MASLRDLAKQIETHKLADSKALELKGKNVRGPSLKPGQIYLAKTWKTTVEDSDNVFLALRFVGSGSNANKDKQMYEENPRLIDMKEGDFYRFERFFEGRINELNAFQSDDCLCFNDPPVRLTFFEIKDVTDQSKPDKPVTEKKTRKVSETPQKAKKPAKASGKRKVEIKEPEPIEAESTITEAETSEEAESVIDESVIDEATVDADHHISEDDKSSEDKVSDVVHEEVSHH